MVQLLLKLFMTFFGCPAPGGGAAARKPKDCAILGI
jgi:hypothetical protein